MDDILHDTGSILLLISLAFSLAFCIHICKYNRKKMKVDFYLMLIFAILGVVCKFYRVVMNITMGIGVLCYIVLGLLIVLGFAVGLFVFIKDIVHRVRSLCKQRVMRRQTQRAEKNYGCNKKEKTQPLLKIKIRKKRQELIVSDIPDDSFFEIQLPPGGLE